LEVGGAFVYIDAGFLRFKGNGIEGVSMMQRRGLPRYRTYTVEEIARVRRVDAGVGDCADFT
jgi:hypothetical protein